MVKNVANEKNAAAQTFKEEIMENKGGENLTQAKAAAMDGNDRSITRVT